MEQFMIDNLAHMIADEMTGAAKYAHCALNYKADRPKLAEMFHEMAEQEMGHMNRLIDTAKEEIKALHDMYKKD